jgi:hypothetical protein
VAAKAKTEAETKKAPRVLRLPDGSRSVSSPWVWRGMLFMSLVALGFCIGLFSNHHVLYGALWAFITVGWLSLSMWLWRRHVREDDEAWRQEIRERKAK